MNASPTIAWMALSSQSRRRRAPVREPAPVPRPGLAAWLLGAVLALLALGQGQA